MGRVEALAVLSLAVGLLGSSLAAPASATKQPMTILFLAGESYPFVFQSLPKDELVGGVEQNTVPTRAESIVGELTGLGFLLLADVTGLGKGTFDIVLLHSRGLNGESCTGEGDGSEGEILWTGTFKFVHDVSAKTGLGILLELNEVILNCGVVRLKLRGAQVGLLSQTTGEVSSVSFSLHCSTTAGEPADVKYWDEEEVEHTARLEINLGTGFKKACENVGAEAASTESLASSRMIEMMF